MTLTQTDAAAALKDIATAHEQSRALFVYQMASPYLLLWGAIWLVGGLIPVPIPANPSIAWLVLDTVGVLASIYIGYTNMRRISTTATDNGAAAGRKWAWRYTATSAVIFLFSFLTIIVFEARTAQQGMTFAAILTSAIFASLGIWIGLRYVVMAAILVTTALTAHFLHVPYEVPVICFAGGATMMMGGLWMRRA